MVGIRITLLSAFLFFGGTHVAQADESACIAEPTRSCLLNLALQQARGAEQPQIFVGSMLKVADAYERMGSDQWRDVVDETMTWMHTRELNPVVMIGHLGGLFRCHPENAQSHLVRHLASVAKEKFAPLEGRARLRAQDYLVRLIGCAEGYEDAVAFLASLKDAEFRATSALAGTFRARDEFDSARKIIDAVPERKAHERMLQIHAISFARAGMFQQGLHTTNDITDLQLRLGSYALVLQEIAQNGRGDEAIVLADELFEGDISSRALASIRRSIVKVYAMMGEQVRLDTVLAIQPEPNQANLDYGFVTEMRAVAALAAGNPDKYKEFVWDIPLGSKHRIDFPFILSAYQVSGQTDLTVFFENLPSTYPDSALHALALVQAEQGDIEGALSTLEVVLQITDSEPLETRVKRSIAKILFDAGRDSEAIEMSMAPWGAAQLVDFAMTFE